MREPSKCCSCSNQAAMSHFGQSKVGLRSQQLLLLQLKGVHVLMIMSLSVFFSVALWCRLLVVDIFAWILAHMMSATCSAFAAAQAD